MSDPVVPFASVFVALPTPFDDAGAVDEAALIHLVDYLSRRDIAGIALLTEAAEDHLLTSDERTRIVERVAKRLGDKRKLLVAISAPATREAVDVARHAEKAGAFGVVVAPLRVPGLGYRELYRHLDRVSRATTARVFLSLRLDNAVDCLAPEEHATLAQQERLAGVFLPDAPQDKIKLWAKRMKSRDGAVFSGCALTFAEAARAGATATICGLAMLATDQSARLTDAVTRGDVDTIRRIEKKTKPAIDLLGPPRAPEEEGGVKRLATRLAQRPLDGMLLKPTVPFRLVKDGLGLQGHPVERFVRPPFEAVSEEESDRLRLVLKNSGLMS